QGNVSGYQGRATECPRALADSQCEPFRYTNAILSVVIKQGASDSVPDQRWSFQTSDGVTLQLVTLNVTSALAGLPRAIAVSRKPARTLYVVDESDPSFNFIDPFQPQLLPKTIR